MDERGVEFGRGVVNYSAEQARKLCGCKCYPYAYAYPYPYPLPYPTPTPNP